VMTSALIRLARLANATSLGVKSGTTSRADTSMLSWAIRGTSTMRKRACWAVLASLFVVPVTFAA
jgi:hypothetical protein